MNEYNELEKVFENFVKVLLETNKIKNNEAHQNRPNNMYTMEFWGGMDKGLLFGTYVLNRR